MASKKKSDFSSAYKLTSGSIDKRTLRLHRRSLEWKSQRQDVVNKCRNLDMPLPALREIVSNSSSCNQSRDTSLITNNEAVKQPVKKLDERREKLSKWRQEKELKKKLEAMGKQKKNPVFKISRFQYKDALYLTNESLLTSSKVKSSFGNTSSGSMKNTCSAKSADTRESTTAKSITASESRAHVSIKPVTSSESKLSGVENKTATTISKNVDSKTSNTSKKSCSTSKSKGDANSTKVSLSRGESANSAVKSASTGKSSSSNLLASTIASRAAALSHSPLKSAANQMSGKPFEKSSKSVAKHGGKPAKATETPGSGIRRITRQMTRLESAINEVAKQNDKNSTTGTMQFCQGESVALGNQNESHSWDELVIDLNKVSTSRGESFTSNSFFVTATGDLQSFTFQPLSPASASKFLCPNQEEDTSLMLEVPELGRCSTPMSIRLGRGATEAAARTELATPALLPQGTMVSVPDLPHCGDVNDVLQPPSSESLTTCDSGDNLEQKQSLSDTEIVILDDTKPSNPSVSSQHSPGGDTLVPETGAFQMTEIVCDFDTESQDVELVSSDKLKLTPTKFASPVVAVVRKDAWSPTKEVNVPAVDHLETVSKSPVKEITEMPMECDENEPVVVVKSPESDVVEMLAVSEVMTTPSSRVTRSRRSMSVTHSFSRPGLPISARKTSAKRRYTEGVKAQKVPKTPEEWVHLLENSPMIEMRRRTPKLKSPDSQRIQTLNFDDVDEELVQRNADSDLLRLVPPETTALSGEASTGISSTAAAEGSLNKPPENHVQLIADGDHDVTYFRSLIRSETARLSSLCDTWMAINSDSSIHEEEQGMIRTAVGKAQLLMNQRFKQFSGLVDDCEFHTGEKETTTMDLQGFWDMIYFQVEDVNTKFTELEELQKNGWERPAVKVTAKQIKKKKGTKPASIKTSGKSKFAAFKAQMKAQQSEAVNDDTRLLETVESVNIGSVENKEKHFEAAPSISSSEELVTADEKMEENNSSLVHSDNFGVSSEAKVPVISPANSISGIITIDVTPRRKSYLPVVPSPLLQDITPKPEETVRPKSAVRRTPRLLHGSWHLGASIKPSQLPPQPTSRPSTPTSGRRQSQSLLDAAASFSSLHQSGTKVTSPGRQLLDPVAHLSFPDVKTLSLGSGGMVLSETTSDLSTPCSSSKKQAGRLSVRRSARIRKSLSFMEEIEKMSLRSESERHEGEQDIGHSCGDMETHIVPSLSSGEKSVNLTETPGCQPTPSKRKKNNGRKSSLKTQRSADKRRSQHNVHFQASVMEEESPKQRIKLPKSPYNHNSLVPKARISIDSSLLSPKLEGEEAGIRESEDFCADLTGLDKFRMHSNQTMTRRSLRSRPSLLYTPEQQETYSLDGRDLMTFSP